MITKTQTPVFNEDHVVTPAALTLSVALHLKCCQSNEHQKVQSTLKISEFSKLYLIIKMSTLHPCKCIDKSLNNKLTGMGILLRSLPIQFFIILHRFKL